MNRDFLFPPGPEAIVVQKDLDKARDERPRSQWNCKEMSWQDSDDGGGQSSRLSLM